MDTGEKGVWGEHGGDVGVIESFEVGDVSQVLGDLSDTTEEVDRSPHQFGVLGNDEVLRKGDCIRITPRGAAYLVRSVNKSRALCTLIYERGVRADSPVINISPFSGVIRIDPATCGGGTTQPVSQETQMSVAGIPVASKTTREQEKARKTSRSTRLVSAGKSNKAKAKAPKGADGRQTRKCECGCKEETMSYFVAGHDARFKGWMVKVERGTMEMGDLNSYIRNKYTFKKRGDGYVSTENYKGEKHDGYDTAGSKPKTKKSKG